MVANSNNIILFPSTPAIQGPPIGLTLEQQYEWQRERVWNIRHHGKFSEDQRRATCHNFITSQELRKSRGAFLRTPDDRALLFDGRFCKLYKIDIDDVRFCGYLHQNYGLNSSESFTRHVVTSLRNGTVASGQLRETRRFSYWDRVEKKLWVSRYDGTCYEVNGDEALIRSNGRGPAIFTDDDGGVNCDEPTIGPHNLLFKHLLDDLQYRPQTAGGLSPELQKTCLGIWLFAIAFPDLMPTKPLLLVEGGRGSGKCLGRGTPVLMHDGTTKPVEDIVEGELVMGPDSLPRTVGGITRGHGPLYRITPVKGDSWVCNEEHILTVVLSGRLNKRGERINRHAVVDAPLKEFAPHEDGSQLKRYGYAMLLRSGIEFAPREVPIDPYLVGLWLGDGTVAYPEITSNDDEILNYCQEIAPKYGVYARIKTDARNGVRAAALLLPVVKGQDVSGRNPLRTFFPTLVINGEKRIPYEYLVNDAHKRRQLLAGLLDTDGYYNRNEYEIVTKHPGLRDDILFLARSLGLAAYSREKVSTIKSTGFSGVYQRIIISGHLDQIPCLLPRKQAVPRQQIKNVLHTGFKIEPIGDGDYYGFTLDKDGRFLLGDFTITHNTFCLQRIAMVIHGKTTALSITKKEDPDFGIKILRSPIAIIDDVNEPVDWLRDTLCTYATGGGWVRRKLFTDDGEVLIKPESFLGITSNNATTFRQGQVADRCLIVRLQRRADEDGYISGDELFETLRYWRAELFGEWLYWLNEIVAELRRPQTTVRTRYRMADFARLAHVIGRVFNRPGGPPGHWSPEAIEAMLGAMQSEREALVIEEDTLIDIIDKWLDVTKNQGRAITMADLFKELSMIARVMNIQAFFKSARALQAHLKEAKDAVTHLFSIEESASTTGSALYTFRRA